MWPQWLTNLADDKLFQVVGGLTSIISFVIGIRVWWIASRISQKISANIRLPALGRALQEDLHTLNGLNLAEAPMVDIMACLARCRSRLQSIRRYNRTDIPRRHLITLELNMVRLLEVFGREKYIRVISHSLHGELTAVVADIDEFSARIPLGVDNG